MFRGTNLIPENEPEDDPENQPTGVFFAPPKW